MFFLCEINHDHCYDNDDNVYVMMMKSTMKLIMKCEINNDHCHDNNDEMLFML